MAVTVLNQGWMIDDHGLPPLRLTQASTNQVLFRQVGYEAMAWNEDAGAMMKVVWGRAGGAITAGALCVFAAGFVATQAGANAIGQVGVAMNAMSSGEYGWFGVAGHMRIKSGDVASGAALYLTATAGTIDDAVASGDLIKGAHAMAADVTTSGAYNENTVLANLVYPHVDDV